MVPKICPRCGNEIDAEEAQGFCPACLVKEGLRSEPEGDPLRKALEAKLQGHYRVVRLVGRGGMGAVYLARDLALDREVAIKVVRTAGDPATVERFRREARTAARLAHPNVVPLHAFGEIEGMPYFVMGFVRGESLADRLQRDGKITEEEARRILGEIADALDHAHRQGIVHRDVKPDNVLLDDETGRALLTDFGVARAIGGGETLTQHGSVIGTPQYMSPEQAAGRGDVDGRSDIYSLGVMGYAMLAGRLPFEGNTTADVLAKQLTQEPVPLRAVAAAVSDSTAQIVDRCLAKDPSGRWQDARSLKRALGVGEESQLPDALHGIEAKGLPAVMVALGLEFIYLLLASDDAWLLLFLETWLVIFFLIAYAFVVFRVTREGFSSAQAQRAIWREPSWWLWWYPRSLRRRGNVWDRLPGVVRAARWSVFAFVIFMCVLYVDLAISKLLGTEDLAPYLLDGHLDRLPTQIGLSILAAIVGTLFVSVSRSRRIFRRAGLAPEDVNRILLTVPPSRASFWTRENVAAILTPVTPSAAPPESPHEQMQAILRDANELSGPLRALGAQAAVAARHLIGSIEHADRQIGDLARNLEPGEEERLGDKIAMLAGVEEYEPMRALLERQLELVRDMAARIEEAKQKRQRRVEMLKTLAMHVAALRARLVEQTPDVRVVSDEVRSLCDEIGRQTELRADRTGEDQIATIAAPGT